MTRLSRNTLLCALACALLPAAAQGAPLKSPSAAPLRGGAAKAATSVAAPSKHLVFAIMRKGSKIGEYTIDIATQGKTVTVDVTTQIKVTILMLTAYHLEHTGQEIWTDGHFVSYKGQTNDNGTTHVVSIAAGPKTTTVLTDGHRSEAPKGALPASLWNTKFIDNSVLIDPDNGKLTPVKITDAGPDPIVLQGVKTSAEHYHIEGLGRDVWMVDGSPVRFQLKGSDNSIVMSELQP